MLCPPLEKGPKNKRRLSESRRLLEDRVSCSTADHSELEQTHAQLEQDSFSSLSFIRREDSPCSQALGCPDTVQ